MERKQISQLKKKMGQRYEQTPHQRYIDGK